MSSRSDKVPSSKQSHSGKASNRVQGRQQQPIGASKTLSSRNNTTNNNGSRNSSTKTTIGSGTSKKPAKQRQSTNAAVDTNNKLGSPRGMQKFTELKEDIKSENNLNEMATTSFPTENPVGLSHDRFAEQETDVDETENRLLSDDGEEEAELLLGSADKRGLQDKQNELGTQNPIPKGGNMNKGDTVDAPLPPGWEQHTDKAGLYYWHVSTGIIQRSRPTAELPIGRGSSVVIYHDDEEINQAPKTSSDEDDYYESGGAALTVDDASESTFVVYPLGCCEFDETQLISATSSKAIQKCILRLSNKPAKEEETVCWGLDQSQPIVMKLFDDHIQFTELKTQLLLRSQPIQTIKTWAVDDNNNFAFVVEDMAQPGVASASDDTVYPENVDYALLSEPILMCYVFRSVDEDDMMSCRVAAKLNEEINRYKEQMLNRMTKSTRLQQMVEVQPSGDIGSDQDGDDDFDELEASNELTMNVKYIGKLPVPRPTGIDVLNVAIDKCLTEATTRFMAQQAIESSDFTQLDARGDQETTSTTGDNSTISPLLDAKLHVSPSSVIVESVTTGEIIVECRIRYLTFMGISKRDIRWCGFIMQNATNKTFVAHCFECHPTAGHVCEAIQLSCSRMYEKVVKNCATRQPETMSIIPTAGSKIRNTLAKTLSRIKLNPLS